jgi:hypothetical protein
MTPSASPCKTAARLSDALGVLSGKSCGCARACLVWVLGVTVIVDELCGCLGGAKIMRVD